jgi:transcription initiation factor IIE alpha subunit
MITDGYSMMRRLVDLNDIIIIISSEITINNTSVSFLRRMENPHFKTLADYTLKWGAFTYETLTSDTGINKTMVHRFIHFLLDTGIIDTKAVISNINAKNTMLYAIRGASPEAVLAARKHHIKLRIAKTRVRK